MKHLVLPLMSVLAFAVRGEATTTAAPKNDGSPALQAIESSAAPAAEAAQSEAAPAAETAKPEAEAAPAAETAKPEADVQSEAAPATETAAKPEAEAAQPEAAPAAAENKTVASAPAIREADTDEIDLEEIDDTAIAARKPQIRQTSDSADFIDISCDEATLADILRQFRKTTKANIICDDSTNLQKRVSAELKHVPWLDALQSILNSRGFRLEERGNIYFVNEDRVLEPVFTKTFQLNHAGADELAKLFNDTYVQKGRDGKPGKPIANSFPEANVVVVTASEKVLADCEAIIRAIDKAASQIYIEARFLELSSDAMHALGLDWSSLEHWGVTASGFKAGFGAANGKSANYGTYLSSRNTTETPTSTITTSTDKDGNQTITTSENTSRSLNNTYSSISPATITEAAGGALSAADMAWRNSYGFSGQLSAKEFSLALSAFEMLGEGKVFSNPKIIVSNGKEAKVDMTTKEPNVTVEASYTGTSSQNMNISTKLEVIPGEDKLMFAKEAFFSYGITLSVKPRISPDGLINVEIVPTISEKKEDKVISGASEQSVYTTYPIINVKRLTTNFTMKDGATAVIGGLTITREDDEDTGIPYLRRIPWIGPRLFGNITRRKIQNEIIVFVTVGIANPAELPKDIGLPTNAVYGREFVEGKRLEPGQRAGGASDVFKIDRRSLDEQERDRPRGTVSITPSAE